MAASSASFTRPLARMRGREKPQLSCNFCRQRKLRCDRKKPCESCTRLGQAQACSYPFPQLPRGPEGGRLEQGRQETLQARINQLELVVRSLLQKQQDDVASSTPESTSSGGTTIAGDGEVLVYDFGRMNIQANESSYVESDHWSAILDEISDLKDMARKSANDYWIENHTEIPQELSGVDFFLLETFPITKMEIIAAIPPRFVVDSILAKHFSSANMPVALVTHRRVFFKQYENFWKDPLGTPIMWLTILFGMMYMVAYCTLYINGGLDPLDEETMAEYKNLIRTGREKMVQCLKLGNYTKGTTYTIEALLAFLQTEYIQGEDAQQGCWQLIGVIIRVAFRMGYHRDGSHFPKMSAYEAEMRRRIWYMLMQFDIASASQVGLPRMIRETQCDTAEPSNLQDDDFDDTTTILPRARPQNEHTLSQFLVYKNRVVSVYGMICDFTTSSKQNDYTQAMTLDNMLNTAYDQKPPVLELKPMSQSIMDGADMITRRLYMTLSFHHAQLTLHRRFMILAKTNTKYTYSHTICIGAALTVLRLQADLFEQCQCGRMLYADRWKITSLVQSEFLLATTILCLNLDDDIVHTRWATSSLSSIEFDQKIIAALQSSQNIWKQQQGISKEAQIAVKAIDVVLTGARSITLTPTSSITTQPSATHGACLREAIDSTVLASYPDGLARRVSSSSPVNNPMSHDYSLASILPAPLVDFSNEDWIDFLDIDQA